MSNDIKDGLPAEYLSFRLGGESYGIDILAVQEIRGYEVPTRMVNAPGDVLGVLNLRGEVVPVTDMRLRFGIEHTTYGAETVTIVLNIEGKPMGIVVDSVTDVVTLDRGQIRPAPAFAGKINAVQVVGLAPVVQADVERMLILLDIRKMFQREVAELEQAA